MHRLRLERVKAGLTLKELAERSGVTIQTISQLERGEREPRPLTIKRLADGLGLPVETLVEEVERHPLPVATSTAP